MANVVSEFSEEITNSVETVFYSSLSSILISDGKYIRKSFFDDKKRVANYHVLKNPNYKKANWNEKHPIQYALYIALFSALLSVITGYILQQLATKKRSYYTRNYRVEWSIYKPRLIL